MSTKERRNSNFASFLDNGPVSWLNVAFRFMQLPIGLFGVAIGTVTLPLVPRHVARGYDEAMRRALRQALEMVALLCVPAAAGLAWFGVPVIGLIYQHGRFTATDTAAAAQALAGYAVGLAGYAGIKGALERENYSVERLALIQAGAVPDGATVLVAAGPTSDLLPPELAAIKAYLAKGGKLLLLMDPPMTTAAPPLLFVK